MLFAVQYKFRAIILRIDLAFKIHLSFLLFFKFWQSLEDELKDLGKDYQVLAECLLATRESRDAEAVNIFIHVSVFSC